MKKILSATVATVLSASPSFAHEIGRRHAVWEHWEIIVSIGAFIALAVFAIMRSSKSNSPK